MKAFSALRNTPILLTVPISIILAVVVVVSMTGVTGSNSIVN